MTNNTFGSEDILINQLKNAYRKYKTQIYYDPHSAIQRSRLADFERVFFTENSNNKFTFFSKDKIDEFFINLANKVINNDLSEFTDNIKVIAFPKKMESEDEESIISNYKETSTTIEQCHYFIDLPIEAHILGVLWILRCGYILDDRLYPHCYGNRLNKHLLKTLEEDDEKCNWARLNNFSPFLFEPYYKYYQSWRDNALNDVKNLLEQKKHAIMISLDFKNYYYSSTIDFELMWEDIKHGKEKIHKNVTEEQNELIDEYESINKNLTCFIKDIFEGYHSQFQINYPNTELPFIPLGFLPSMIIANWNLQSFDQAILEDVRPSYYGRYVDDILIVLDSHEKSELYDEEHFKDLTPDNIIKKYLTKDKTYYPLNKIFNFEDTDSIRVYNLQHRVHNKKCVHYDNLQIQGKKVKLYSFSYKNSTAIIDNFKNQIRKNSSEFRFMNDSDELFNQFEEKLFEIDYVESINKLTNIQKVRISKYEISKLMTGVLRSTAFSNDIIEETLIDKVVEAFNCDIFRFFTLWEKIITLLYINKNDGKLKEFIENVLIKINELNFKQEKRDYQLNKDINDDCKLIIKSLKKYLISTTIRVLSLKSTNIYKDLSIFKNKNGSKEYLIQSFSFILSSMINNSFMKYPIQNKFRVQQMIKTNMDSSDKINYDLINNNECNLNTPIFNGFCYPRYIKFHEIVLNNLYNTIYFKRFKNHFEDDFDDLMKSHSKLNFYEPYTEIEMVQNIEKYIKLNCDLKCQKHDDCPVNDNYKTLKIGSKTKTKLNVGLVNTKLNMGDFENRLLGKSNLKLERFNKIKRLINEAIKNNVDLLLMPEMYIPFEWMGEIISTSKTHQMAMIFGVEPIVSNNTVYNYIMSSLPFSIDDSYFETIVSCRLKNDYSPKELQIITSYHLKEPKKEMKYYLYSWNGIHIVPYYCYELADIQSRSKFKSCCDIITVSEFNKDEIYFGNIAESLSRDLYCYCIKSNTSEFGGNSIIQPAPSEMRKIVELKGGENDYLVIQELDIDKLRKNAIKSDLIPTTKDKTLKPNPPKINPDIIKERMGLNNKFTNNDYKNLYDDIPPHIIENIVSNFISKRFKNELSNKSLGIWGLSLKPNTTNIIDSPSNNIIKELLKYDAKIKVYDPKNNGIFEETMNDASIEYCESKYDALNKSNALIILTGWEEFKSYDLNEMGQRMEEKIIMDCRNIIKDEKDEKGFEIHKILINKI